MREPFELQGQGRLVPRASDGAAPPPIDPASAICPLGHDPMQVGDVTLKNFDANLENPGMLPRPEGVRRDSCSGT